MKTGTLIAVAGVAVGALLAYRGVQVARSTVLLEPVKGGAQSQRDAALDTWVSQWNDLHLSLGDYGLANSQAQSARAGVPLFASAAV